MDYLEVIRSALLALQINKLRTLLTMLGIVIGISSVILIYSMGQGAVAFITNELTSFGTDYFQINPGQSQVSTIAGSNTLTMKDVELLKQDTSLTNVKQVAPLTMTTAVVAVNNEEEEYMIYGATAEIYDMLRPDIIDGEFITAEQEQAGESVAVLGSAVADKLFGDGQSAVGETVTINNRNYRVTGVVNSTSVLAGGFLNKSVFIPLSVVFQNIIRDDHLFEIDVSVHDPNSINQTMADVEALLRDQHNLSEGEDSDFQLTSLQDMLSTTQTITSLLTVMVVAISGISLIVGGVGVMNIMLVSVTERTREIGLLKAIGVKEKDILTQFLFEAVVMTCTGGILGILLGMSGSFLISQAFGIPFIVSLPAILVAVSVSSGVGILFGLYPARKAAALSPIDALQYQ